MQSEYSPISIEGSTVDNIGSVMAIVPFHTIAPKITLYRESHKPSAGDIIMTQISPVNKKVYITVQNLYGRMVNVYPHNIVVGVIGPRESTTHIVGKVPERTLKSGSELFYLSEGGVMGDVSYIPPSMGTPTKLKHIGFLKYNGKILNMRDFAPTYKKIEKLTLPPIILVVGTSSEIGKTTVTSRIINILRNKYKKRISSVMMSGVGSKADALNHLSAGSHAMHSFIELGYPSTYDYIPDDVFLEEMEGLLSHISVTEKPDFIIGELGGDFVSAKNDVILTRSQIMKSVRGIVVITGDILAAIGTDRLFKEWKIACPHYYANSWLRAYGGMKMRYDRTLKSRLYDVTNIDDLELMVDEIIGTVYEKKNKTRTNYHS